MWEIRIFILILVFTFTLFSFPGGSYTAPSNGTGFPPKGKAEAGYEFNLMQRRALRRSYGTLSTRNHFYTFSLRLSERFCLDGKLGLGDLRHKGGIYLPKVDYNTGFAGGYGFRFRAFEDKETGISAILGFQHISVHPRDTHVDENKYEAFLDEWQLSALAAKDFAHFSAYAGVKGSDCEIVYKINEQDRKRRFSKQHIGIITGLDLYLAERKVRINLEARFIDETAFSVTVAYLF